MNERGRFIGVLTVVMLLAGDAGSLRAQTLHRADTQSILDEIYPEWLFASQSILHSLEKIESWEDWRLFGHPDWYEGTLVDALKQVQIPTLFTEAIDPWSMTKDWHSPGKVKIRQEVNGSLLYSKTKFDLPRVDTVQQDPHVGRDWRAEETLRLSLPMVEGLFVFGQFNGNGDAFNYQRLRTVMRTGVGWRTPLPKGELQFRGGPMVAYTDTPAAIRVDERSQFMFEVLATVPLYGPLSIEYTGSAIPGVLPTDRDQINQDLRIALPIGSKGEFHVGARYRWEYAPVTTPWVDRTQLYLGVELKH